MIHRSTLSPDFSSLGGLSRFFPEHLRSFGSHGFHRGSMSRTGTALTGDLMSVG